MSNELGNLINEKAYAGSKRSEIVFCSATIGSVLFTVDESSALFGLKVAGLDTVSLPLLFWSLATFSIANFFFSSPATFARQIDEDSKDFVENLQKINLTAEEIRKMAIDAPQFTSLEKRLEEIKDKINEINDPLEDIVGSLSAKHGGLVHLVERLASQEIADNFRSRDEDVSSDERMAAEQKYYRIVASISSLKRDFDSAARESMKDLRDVMISWARLPNLMSEIEQRFSGLRLRTIKLGIFGLERYRVWIFEIGFTTLLYLYTTSLVFFEIPRMVFFSIFGAKS